LVVWLVCIFRVLILHVLQQLLLQHQLVQRMAQKRSSYGRGGLKYSSTTSAALSVSRQPSCVQHCWRAYAEKCLLQQTILLPAGVVGL
jgi:hypothetical protein